MFGCVHRNIFVFSNVCLHWLAFVVGVALQTASLTLLCVFAMDMCVVLIIYCIRPGVVQNLIKLKHIFLINFT